MIRDSDTLQALLAGIDRFVREVLVPAEKEADETDELPPHSVQGMKDLGLCGMTIPEAHGGLGLTTEEEVPAIALCHASPAFRSLIGTPIGIGAFIVDAGTPGISFGKRDRKMGQNGSHTCDVILDGVRVPAARIIDGAGDTGNGFKTAMKVLGADKGALMLQERRVADAATGELPATVTQAAGFVRPVLHGLATMGVALHAVLKALLGYDATAVRGMRVRFTAPVLPGETSRTEPWRDGGVVSLRATALERGVVVLDAGRVVLA